MVRKLVQLLRSVDQAFSRDRKQAPVVIIARLKELRPRPVERTFIERRTCPDGRVQDFFEETVAINGLQEYTPTSPTLCRVAQRSMAKITQAGLPRRVAQGLAIFRSENAE